MDILELSKQNRQIALEILEKTNIIKIWESIGAEVHIVGSVKSGLLMKCRDIDMHIYTGTLSVAESFTVMKQLAEQLPLKEMWYKNLIDTEEECIEWHALYEHTDMHTWKFDMIHIRKGSKYDGVVEKVTDNIIRCLTPEIRNAILRIKFDMPEDINIPGIEIYRAVFSYGIRSYEEFAAWRRTTPAGNTLEWTP